MATNPVRIGTTIRSGANIVYEAPLPGGFQLVVFQDRRGDLWPYIFGDGAGAASAASAAEGLLAGL